MGGAGGVPGGRGWVSVRLLWPVLLLMQQSKKMSISQSTKVKRRSINQTTQNSAVDVTNAFVAVGKNLLHVNG